jgi:hypothetical protein
LRAVAEDRITGVIEIGTITDPIEACVQPIRRWLDARADIAPYVIRPLVDVWHGPFDDLKTIDEPLPSPVAASPAHCLET